MGRTKLAKLLLEDSTIDAGEHKASAFGVEQVLNVRKYLQERLSNWDASHPMTRDYDPLLEIAKLATLVDDVGLQFKCHQLLAGYMYPQVRSLEIQAKQDREITFNINIAGYAKATQDVETTAEHIETEGDLDDEPVNYLEQALGKTQGRSDES